MHAFFYKQHFHKQRRTETGKKSRKSFCYLKFICLIHPRHHPKIIGDILKNVQKTSDLMRFYD